MLLANSLRSVHLRCSKRHTTGETGVLEFFVSTSFAGAAQSQRSIAMGKMPALSPLDAIPSQDLDDLFDVEGQHSAHPKEGDRG